MHILRLIIGILLLPACYATTRVVMDLSAASHPTGTAAIPPASIAMGGGYILWLVVYFTMPKPVRTYILAHELTHALWGAMMGAKIFKMSVRRDSGSVTLSKTNFLITLAPYFFPLYTVLIVIAYYVLGIFYDPSPYYLWWLALVGFTWGFHFTFTISSLLQHQTDIQAYGLVFSYATIYLFNALGICFWIILVSPPTIEDCIALAGARSGELVDLATVWIRGLLE
jgi:hypothetical protein